MKTTGILLENLEWLESDSFTIATNLDDSIRAFLSFDYF